MEYARVMQNKCVREDILEMNERNDMIWVVVTMKTDWEKKQNQIKEPLPYCHDYGHQIKMEPEQKKKIGIRRPLDIAV